ncbi:hypothetical protein CRG98_008681 [Punica granatum]|uniref:Uncharacterized protein n=1 Tax=Punica granatum TaxID=22663 RepID=A0A2I0KR17_PUNGR|nr:hypothetical protein CRG98_008681 [Punica granatum]
MAKLCFFAPIALLSVHLALSADPPQISPFPAPKLAADSTPTISPSKPTALPALAPANAPHGSISSSPSLSPSNAAPASSPSTSPSSPSQSPYINVSCTGFQNLTRLIIVSCTGYDFDDTNLFRHDTYKHDTIRIVIPTAGPLTSSRLSSLSTGPSAASRTNPQLPHAPATSLSLSSLTPQLPHSHSSLTPQLPHFPSAPSRPSSLTSPKTSAHVSLGWRPGHTSHEPLLFFLFFFLFFFLLARTDQNSLKHSAASHSPPFSSRFFPSSHNSRTLSFSPHNSFPSWLLWSAALLEFPWWSSSPFEPQEPARQATGLSLAASLGSTVHSATLSHPESFEPFYTCQGPPVSFLLRVVAAPRSFLGALEPQWERSIASRSFAVQFQLLSEVFLKLCGHLLSLV